MAFRPETVRYLDGLGLVRDARVVRKDIAAQFVDALRKSECNDLEQVEVESKLVSEWRSEVLGNPTDPLVELELNQLAGQLLSIGANGPVQKGLEDGVVLCKTNVRRVDDNGEAQIKKGRGRVVSSDPDVIERCHDVIKATEALRKVTNTRASFDLSARRVPALAQRHRRMLTRTSEEMEQLLLTTGEQS